MAEVASATTATKKGTFRGIALRDVAEDVVAAVAAVEAATTAANLAICPETAPNPEPAAAAAVADSAAVVVAAAAAVTIVVNLAISLATVRNREAAVAVAAAVAAVGRPPNATNAKDLATSLATAPRNLIRVRRPSADGKNASSFNCKLGCNFIATNGRTNVTRWFQL